MTLDTNDVVTIISALNKTGGIPLQVTTTATTEWTQFGLLLLSTLMGSIFIFIFLWNDYIRPFAGRAYLWFALRRFKKLTGKNIIIIKHTMSQLFAQSMIDIKTLENFERALQKFKGKPFDIILHTPGGEIFFTQLICKLIKEYGQPIRAIVPFYSMSGGTMIALSCNEILMGNSACLGPIDPQLGGIFSYGSARSWREVVKKKGRKANDASIQFAYIGEQYTKTIRANLKEVLSNKIIDQNQMEQTLDFFTAGTIEHAYQISPEQLTAMGIPAKQLPLDIQKPLGKIIMRDWIEGTYYL